MSKWKLKLVVQKTISFLPYKNKINLLFQKYVTKGVDLNDEHFGNKITHARDHLNYLLKYKRSTNQLCLELGTGWYPIVPIALFLNGVPEIHTIDISALLNQQTFKDTLKKYIEWDKQGKLSAFLPQLVEDNWTTLLKTYEEIDSMTLEEVLQVFKIKSAVGDARNMEYPDNTFDFICSNNTFEHVYPEVLKDILIEFKRVVKTDGGLMSHFIDMSDHFAHYDKSITIYNFLKYSERQWNLMDNSIQPQNRWRLVQFKDLYKELGIKMVEEVIWETKAAALDTIKVAPMFEKYSRAELAVCHAYLISG